MRLYVPGDFQKWFSRGCLFMDIVGFPILEIFGFYFPGHCALDCAKMFSQSCWSGPTEWSSEYI